MVDMARLIFKFKDRDKPLARDVEKGGFRFGQSYTCQESCDPGEGSG